MAQRVAASSVRFDSTFHKIEKTVIARLPATASRKLPSRGQVAVEAMINGHPFQTVLEPDGVFGHWIKLDRKVQRAIALRTGERASVEVTPLRDWPEPTVPQDLKAALAAAPQRIRNIWKDITPMARWEWVRWVNATRDPVTRKRRVDVSISKMDGGKRRPCCFDLSSCTDPDLSRSGKLIDPA
jgi:hypothetical protein